MCLYSIFEQRITLKDGVESISSSVLQSKTTAAVHIARVLGVMVQQRASWSCTAVTT
jgi:hypothetical protein